MQAPAAGAARTKQCAAAVQRLLGMLGLLELDKGDARLVVVVAQEPDARHGAWPGSAASPARVLVPMQAHGSGAGLRRGRQPSK